MEPYKENNISSDQSGSYMTSQVEELKTLLSGALDVPKDSIRINFPLLSNFYLINSLHKSSWGIYYVKDESPQLLYTGNYLIQGADYSPRSSKSPFGVSSLSNITSIANTFSYEASLFKQNWALDLNLFEEDNKKLRFTVEEYKYFLKLLNQVRASWLLHLCEEGKFDFVICEYSAPSDHSFFIQLDSIDSVATKIKSYFHFGRHTFYKVNSFTKRDL